MGPARAAKRRSRPPPYVRSLTRTKKPETDGVLADGYQPASLSFTLSSCETRTQKPETEEDLADGYHLWTRPEYMLSVNSDSFDALEGGEEIVRNVMEALDDSNTHLVGVYGPDAEIIDDLLERVYRRAERDELFGVVVKATVTRKPDVGKIQEDIARELHFTFSQKSKAKRATELIHRIGSKDKILIVLYDLHKKLDLSEVGIPNGADHPGCKIITTEDVLSNHMHTQKNFKI